MAVISLKTKPTKEDLLPEKRPYEPHGGCAEIFRSKEPECLLAGAAGTGKSMAILSKLFFVAEKYPGCRILMCRKTRESMTESTLVTWENKVVPEGHPCLNGAQRNQRTSYHFENGSEVVVGGLRQASRDNSQKIMSTDYDIAYVPEAIELTEHEWELITSRLRNFKIPYQQLIADTNPSSPTHWLKKRCNSGKCKMIHTDHKDNPSLWDRANKRWTPEGEKYIDKLKNLTGARRARLYKGEWVQAEGVVYENWNDAANVIEPFEIPKDWRNFVAVDFGFNEPFVALFGAIDNDDHLYIYREYVKTKTLVEDHAPAIERYLADRNWPEAIVCDHDAEGRATLEKHLGRGTVAARKEVLDGIQVVESRLAVQKDGKPRLMIFRDCLQFRDENMEEAKKPIGLLEEIPEYVWDKVNPEKPKERPIEYNNHSADALRYLCTHLEHGVWLAPDPIIVEQVDPVQDWRTGKTDWRKKGNINWRLQDEL